MLKKNTITCTIYFINGVMYVDWNVFSCFLEQGSYSSVLYAVVVVIFYSQQCHKTGDKKEIVQQML